MNREHASRLLSDVHGILDEMNIRHFLIDGTLLGAVREGDFIAHDLDMDMGVYVEDWSDSKVTDVIEAMQRINVDLVHKLGELDKYFELSFRRDGIKIDLFFYRKEGNLRIFHAFKNGGRNLPDDVITYEYQAHLIEELRPMMFQNALYPAPADSISVLIAKYGLDWRIPVTKWDWQYGPKNVRK